MTTSLRTTLLAGLVVATAFLSGCATASKSDAMAITAVDLGTKHAQSVSLKVTGGRETSAAGASQISDKNFQAAVAASIEKTQLFAKLLGVNEADYHLEILIARIDQPMFGFNMTVTIETNWTLSRKSDGAVVWQKAIPSTYTAKTGDAFAGVTRLRLANEGAARVNIEQALKDIAGVNLAAK